MLDGVINTCCIDLSEWGFFCPKTVSEFTDGILRVIPSFLKPDFLCEPLVTFGEDIYEVKGLDGDELFCPPYEIFKRNLWRNRGERKFDINELTRLPKWAEFEEFPVFKAVLAYEKGPYIKAGENFGFTLTLINNGVARSQLWANVKVMTSGGLTVAGGGEFALPLQNTYRYEAKQKFSVTLNENHSATEDIFAVVELNGRHSFGTLRAKLIVADSRDITNE